MSNQLGRYEVTEVLGWGSTGIVYKARDPLIDRFVAIKVINLQVLNTTEQAEYKARFNMEARAAGRLSHPNIVTIHDFGEGDELAYIAMELIEGRELQSIIADEQRLEIDEILDIAIQVATGLDFADHYGVVHLDIKPSNIIVMHDHRVKIVDFGIARISSCLVNTEDGDILGTPLYMSPEQIMNRAVDTRSDIFSLGNVLYQMLTGRTPFQGNNFGSVMFQINNSHPPSPSSLKSDVPDMLDPIVLKCLAKDPLERYQSASKLAADLRACRAKLINARKGLDVLKHFKKLESPPVHQLIYESRLTNEVSTSDLLNILTKSQFKNIRLDLSGLLIFHNGKFMQLLEGGKIEVDELFATIQQDHRHTDVNVVFESDSYYRCMPSWVMGLSTGGQLEGNISDKNFYIPPDVTIQICESMEAEIGNKFLQFISHN